MDIRSLVRLKDTPHIPDFRSGDTVRVFAKIVEGDRERVQAFEGVVIRIRRRGIGSSFTVRRVSHGVGVERTFPYYSPLVERVQVTRVGRVRRAKLYYLRDRVGRAARIKAGSRARFQELTAAALEPEAAVALEEEAEAAEEEEAVVAEEELAEEGEVAEAEAEGEAEEPEEEAEGEEKG